MTKHDMQIFGWAPFQATKQQLNGEKWDVGYLSDFLRLQSLFRLVFIFYFLL